MISVFSDSHKAKEIKDFISFLMVIISQFVFRPARIKKIIKFSGFPHARFLYDRFSAERQHKGKPYFDTPCILGLPSSKFPFSGMFLCGVSKGKAILGFPSS